MSFVTGLAAWASLVAGVGALVAGFRLGHGEGDLGSHLTWGVLSLLFQFVTALLATLHGRASAREIDGLRAALDASQPVGSAARE